MELSSEVGDRREEEAKEVLSRNALSLSPQGVPMQFAPLVVESKERPPSRSPTGVTFRK